MKSVAIDQAIQAAQTGDYAAAHKAFRKAIRQQPRQASHRYNYALLHLQGDDMAEAAVHLCEALQVDPGFEVAAQRLGSILTTYQLPDDCRLNPFGLRAALDFISVDHQAIISTAFVQLQHHTALGDILAKGAGQGYEAAARMLLSAGGRSLLTNRLFLSALSLGLVRMPALEGLLTQTRRLILLEHIETDFAAVSTTPFIVALARQCHNNEFVWLASVEEQDCLSIREVCVERALAGDKKEAALLLVQALYSPVTSLMSGIVEINVLEAITHAGLRELTLGVLPEAWAEAKISIGLPSHGLSGDAVSVLVAGQYEGNPYPRWLSLPKPAANALQRLRETVLDNRHTATLSGTHDILIAGAGTGRQAIYSAMVHGPDTRIVALDLSKRSLAYGARMAEKFNIGNIEFLQADILNLSKLDRTFDVIECTGVLHHMDDPFKGWRALLEHLKPSGLMLIALYSAVSRQNIQAKRVADDFPGAGCDDDTLRTYRTGLMAQDDVLVHSEDFYSLSDFRDLVLHEHESQMTLPQIGEFLKEADLEFHGFVLPPGVMDAYSAAFPDDKTGRNLENWWRFEQDNPQTFDAMYQFWCRKR